MTTPHLLNGFPADFAHNVPFAAQVFVAQTHKVVYHESCNRENTTILFILYDKHKKTTTNYFRSVGQRTFVAIPDCKEIHVVVFVVEEQQTDPRVERVNGHYEQYSDYPSLLRRVRVPPEMIIYLKNEVFFFIIHGICSTTVIQT